MSLVNSSPEKAKLQKQLDKHTQYQWLTLIPAQASVLSTLFHTTPLSPNRVFIVWTYLGAVVTLSVICFALVHARIGKLKRALAQLERAEQTQQTPP